MKLTDLTLPIAAQSLEREAPADLPQPRQVITTRIWSVADGARRYQARVHDIAHWSMAGTYLDLPGHIVETDDGVDAVHLPLARLYRLASTVVRLQRVSGSGRIGADELAAAAPDPVGGAAMVINALGTRRFDEIEYRSVYLGIDAAQWIIDAGVQLLVSDVYESDAEPQGVFPALFRRGICAVCCPVELHRLGNHPLITALPLRTCGATQVPCRLLAEEEERR